MTNMGKNSWSRLKCQVKSWFAVDTNSDDELIARGFGHKSSSERVNNLTTSQTTTEDLKESSRQQDEIMKMRESLAEARGGQRNRRHDPLSVTQEMGESKTSEKPPVPPTRSLAVVKLKAALREAQKDQNADKANGIAVQESQPKETKQEEGTLESHTTKLLDLNKNLESEKSSNDIEGSKAKETDEEAAARKAAVRAKIRAALLSASTMQPEVIRQTGQEVGAPVPGRGFSKQAGRGGSVRRSSAGAAQEKPKETIWEFFEEGKKKGTCKTCGYVVGIKHNKGGLTRHLSLVHQRQYKEYTARMEKNWTHGMIERNLNMAVPKNI